MAKDHRVVWEPASWEPADLRAIQAISQGVASEQEQKRGLNWIINNAASTYDNGFVAADPHGRIAAYMDGRQSVGQQIVKLIKLKAELFKEHPTNE